MTPRILWIMGGALALAGSGWAVVAARRNRSTRPTSATTSSLAKAMSAMPGMPVSHSGSAKLTGEPDPAVRCDVSAPSRCDSSRPKLEQRVSSQSMKRDSSR